jgi:hypothetical protein
MIAVHSNLLVYAHREDSPWHPAAYARIVELGRGCRSMGDPMAVHSRISIHCDASSNLCPSHAFGKGY